MVVAPAYEAAREQGRDGDGDGGHDGAAAEHGGASCGLRPEVRHMRSYMSEGVIIRLRD